MKKLLALLLAMLICLGMFASCGVEKSSDSIDLTQQERSLAQTTIFDSVIKICSCDSLPEPVAQDLNVRNIFCDYYIVHPFSLNLLVKDKYYDCNGVFTTTKLKKSTKSKFFDYALYPEKIFGYFVSVENVYCTYSGYSADILCIYYETSNGDYVLATHASPVGTYDSNEEIYLFPIENYREISDLHTEKILSLPMPVDGGISLDSVADISQYEITPRALSWSAIWGIVVASVSICATIAVIAIKKMRKTNHN